MAKRSVTFPVPTVATGAATGDQRSRSSAAPIRAPALTGPRLVGQGVPAAVAGATPAGYHGRCAIERYAEETVTEPRRGKIRVMSVREQADHVDVSRLTPEQRLDMMWQLAVDAWVFKGDTRHAESRLQRHVVRVYWRER